MTDRGTAIQEAGQRLGISELYDDQQRVVEETLAGRDVLMVLPTGYGKSACYQIPSMLLPQPVVLISPLLALLKDQQRRLDEHQVPCVRLDGGVRGRARAQAFERIGAGGPLLVMTTPESLGSPDLCQVLSRTGVGLAAVDEAHCISEWGFDFRPAYLQLGTRLRALGNPPLLALTATATERVREQIVRSLGMREPAVVATSPHRSNLAFEVLACEGDARARALLRLAQRLRRPGIVYCATRREVDDVYVLLRRFEIPTQRYHGGMTTKERNESQEGFMRRGRRSVMVATNAFGLGIDKADIRFVLHYQSPASLEQYVQEAGRAGRDGKKANGILLYDPADRAIHEALLARSRVRPDQLFRLGRTLEIWAREKRNPSLEALALSTELGPRVTEALLAKFEEAGVVELADGEVRLAESPDAFGQDAERLAGQFDRLRSEDARRLDAVAAYAGSSECLAVFLRRYFGEEGGKDCGLCNICRGRTERPDSFFSPVARPTPPPPPRRRSRRRSRGRAGEKPAYRGDRSPRPERGPRPDRSQRPDRGPRPERAPGSERERSRRRRRPSRRRRPRRSPPPGQPPAPGVPGPPAPRGRGGADHEADRPSARSPAKGAPTGSLPAEVTP